ncbi:hypothetical protein SIN09_29710 [Streptomyces sp. F8]|uniref:hypothetical protein n=1 Tax=Streptomyces sp. F8 TaxID=1436085 RepID=UPI0029CBFFCC|nr:hypothetical protein [Streptomyces sp. F8]MDX6763467.1 hypothetical protein [Streptomyces sp. F8]
MVKEPHPDDAVTIETPAVKRVVRPDDVTQTVPVPKVDPSSAASAVEETAVLPPVRPADETAVLPPVRPDAPQGSGSGGSALSATRPTARRPEEDPADRVPSGIFRDSSNDRTRELPVVDDDGRPRRPRPDWAEETPLDDLPTLADELLGRHRDKDDDEGEGTARRTRR